MWNWKLIITGCLILLLSSTFGCRDSRRDRQVFQGLEDSLAVQRLKSFPDEHRVLNVPPADARFLYDLVLQHGYKHGLEIGTANGYSALWLGMAFRKTGGHLTTIEINPEIARFARRNLRLAELTDIVESRVNDGFLEIPQLESNFDFVFIDAWKKDTKKFFELLYPKVVAGGAITAHNVLDSADEMKDFLRAIESNSDLDTTIYKTSNRGISVSIKKAALPRTEASPAP